MFKENIPPYHLHNQLPGTVDPRQVVSLDSFCRLQILRRPSAPSAEIPIHQTGLQLSGVGESVSPAASDFCCWLTQVELDLVLCCCRPSTSRVDFFGDYHSSKEWSSELLSQTWCPAFIHNASLFYFVETRNYRRDRKFQKHPNQPARHQQPCHSHTPILMIDVMNY